MSSHLLFHYHPGDAFSVTGTTFARSTTAHYVDAAGVMQVAAIDAPRDASYSGADGVRRLLLEASRTNLVPYGEPTTSNLYAKTAGVTNATAARGMGRLAFAINSSGSEYALQRVTLAADATVVISIYIDTDDDGAPLVYPASPTTFNFNTPGTWTPGAVTVESVATRVWRVSQQRAAVAGANQTVGIFRGSGYLQRVFRVTGWQLEVAASSSAFMHSGGTSATRAADVMTTPLPAGVAATRYERYIDQATLTLVERATPYVTPASLAWDVDRAWEAQVIAAGTWSLDAMRVFAQPERAVGATPAALVVTTASATLVPGYTYPVRAAFRPGIATSAAPTSLFSAQFAVSHTLAAAAASVRRGRAALSALARLTARALLVWPPTGHGTLRGTITATPALTASLTATPALTGTVRLNARA